MDRRNREPDEAEAQYPATASATYGAERLAVYPFRPNMLQLRMN